MKSNRLMLFIISLLMVISFALACGGGSATDSDDETDDGDDDNDDASGDDDADDDSDDDIDDDIDDDDADNDFDDDADDDSLAVIADHHAADDFDQIPENMFQAVRDELFIYYGHTSHGGQIISGIDMLEEEDGTLYAGPEIFEHSWDLGEYGDTEWADRTRDFLDGPDGVGCNVVMWSWCEGTSHNDFDDTQVYLDTMMDLESDYPDVTFVYMTGHSDMWAQEEEQGNNNLIRNHCRDHDSFLYDFGDIEYWDPDGNFYPDAHQDCQWCLDWCDDHNCPDCDLCGHSECFLCYRKGQAIWWQMARMAGWSG